MCEIEHPECEKLLAVRNESQVIGEFLDWLKHDTCLTICRDHVCGEDCDRFCNTIFEPSEPTINDLLSRYFDIDMSKVEEERRKMLEAFNVHNAR